MIKKAFVFTVEYFAEHPKAFLALLLVLLALSFPLSMWFDSWFIK